MTERWTIAIGGTRGSATVTGGQYAAFGGDTVSVRVCAGGAVLYLDAGSGILPLPEGARRADVLIGHPHLDHLCGLGIWPALTAPENRIDFYMTPRAGLGCRAQLDRLYAPPLWPLRIGELPAQTVFHDIAGDFALGGLRVRVMEGFHPGGVTHFRISDGVRSLVYAVDAELTEESAARLAEFARGCDLLICDGQFTREELAEKRGWGHSSMAQAAALGKAAGAGETILLHYLPHRTDAELRALGERIAAEYPDCRPARQGEEIAL